MTNKTVYIKFTESKERFPLENNEGTLYTLRFMIDGNDHGINLADTAVIDQEHLEYLKRKMFRSFGEKVGELMGII